MRTEELEYALPAATIAQRPAEPRDSARLLVGPGLATGDVRTPGAGTAEGNVHHSFVRDLPGWLRGGDLLVLNTTRVLPSRVPVVRDSGGTGEVLLLEDRGDGTWEALCRPSRKMAPGSCVQSVGGSLKIEMGTDLGGGRRLVRPLPAGYDTDTRTGPTESDAVPWLPAVLQHDGELPLPPYITEELDDPERYQTCFADRPLSAAAPTAGLHFTPRLLEELRGAGVGIATVELVVGLDTFRPVTSERLEDHRIHSERFEVSDECWEAVRQTRAGGGRVVAVGTTTVRALESRASGVGSAGRTELFITPGFEFSVVDVLLTNFHLPRSSLLALVEAFTGPLWRDLYSIALVEGYRFLSFGDAMLLARQVPR